MNTPKVPEATKERPMPPANPPALSELLTQIRERLAVIESKLGTAESTNGDLEERVRDLEKFKSQILGAVAASGVAGGVLGAVLSFLANVVLGG